MQDPNEDTEWNDILRAKGIIPSKAEIELTEDEIIDICEETISRKTNGRQLDDMTLDQIDELEDEFLNDERFMQEYRFVIKRRFNDISPTPP